jgi:hypothetical protein
MRYIAVILILLSALLLWGQAKPGSGIAPSQPTYELTANTEIKFGIREYAETTYTYSQTVNGTKRELWRILQRDKYAHHWISPNGIVWVLTEGMPGPGGAGRLWARDPNCDLKGGWPDYQTMRVSGVGSPYPSTDLDLSACQAISLHNGSEQLRLVRKDGSEFRATIAVSEQGDFLLSRTFEKGQPKTDLFTELCDKPYNAPTVEWPAPGKAPIAIWTFFNENPNRYLIQTFRLGSGLDPAARQSILAERPAPQKPAFVDKTLTGKILWWEFGGPGRPPLAKLDVLSYDGSPIQTVDLLKLGKFQSSDDAHLNIQYRDVLDNAGGGPMPTDSEQRYGPGPLESLTFGDRTGRKYVVDIRAKGNQFEVLAKASMNLDQIPTKEPTYPDAMLGSSASAASDDGKFTAEVKNYARGNTKQSQVTLTAHVNDPVEGEKAVQLFSSPIPYQPTSIRVTNTGRLYCLGFITPPVPGGKQMVYLQVFDPSGHQMGIDLLSLKWFGDISQAKKEVDLRKVAVSNEGPKPERTIEGVPVPSFASEELTFDLGSRKQKLWVGYMNDQLPTMFYMGRPPLR